MANDLPELSKSSLVAICAHMFQYFHVVILFLTKTLIFSQPLSKSSDITFLKAAFSLPNSLVFVEEMNLLIYWGNLTSD